MSTIKNWIYIIIVSFLFISCGENKTATDDHGHSHENTHEEKNPEVEKPFDEDHGKDNGIHLTKQQVETVGISYGELTEIKINDYVKTTGTLGLPADAYASVSSKSEGFIKNAKKYVEGSSISKGAIIAFIENPKLIEKQELLLSLNAELSFLEKEYRRQKSLFDENAGVERTVQKLQSELEVKRAQKLGAKHYLSYLGVNTDDVLRGKFIQKIPIVAPISGFITSIDMHNGMYVSPEKQLLEIVSDKHLHLELDVFENDISKVKKNQKITYIVPAIGNETFEGEVHEIGKEFDGDNKTVRVHGHLEGKRPTFIKDLFITAKIWLNDTKVLGLPVDAILKDGPSRYIYYSRTGLENDHGEIEFEKLMVLPGIIEGEFVSIKLLEELPKDSKIVTKGAYFIYAQSKYGEAVHEH